MSIEVLKTASENKTARMEMRRQGIDCISPFYLRIARKTGILNGINVGEFCKSWDVLKTVKIIQHKLSYMSPILDIGAYASEVLCALHRLGYEKLSGVDLNPTLVQMPYHDKINYVVSDFMQMPFEDASFSAVTAISVIEHGFQREKLLAEISRILKSQGYFIASVDYWPDKIDTHHIRAFGMDWTIFSKDDLYAFIKEAAKFDLKPCGTLHFDASERVVKWKGKQYTFAWLAMQKL